MNTLENLSLSQHEFMYIILFKLDGQIWNGF